MGFFISRIVRVFLLGGGVGKFLFYLCLVYYIYCISNGNNYVFMLNIMKFWILI